jgi:hypothetical protein
VTHNPNPQHIQSLVDCKQGMPHLVDLFDSALSDVTASLVETEDKDRMLRLQGQAYALRSFLDAVETSHEVKTRMETP